MESRKKREPVSRKKSISPRWHQCRKMPRLAPNAILMDRLMVDQAVLWPYNNKVRWHRHCNPSVGRKGSRGASVVLVPSLPLSPRPLAPSLYRFIFSFMYFFCLFLPNFFTLVLHLSGPLFLSPAWRFILPPGRQVGF